ncbi:MAG TPA: hypothetical protein PKD54_10120 [Pirellulaceae bacterium]|nr:hypothetical protein [Pirellulaceae bacterium]
MAERQERRSIADAMQVTPEALAFIQGTANKTVEVKTKSATKPKTDVQESVESPVNDEPMELDSMSDSSPQAPVTERRRTYRSNSGKPKTPSGVELGFGMANLLVPLTTRLQPATAAALKRAGLEQKLRGHEPSTVQEIAEIAIQGWLKDNGFLS